MVTVAGTFTILQGLIDAIPNPVFVKDRSHRVVLLNDSTCALFGYSREELLSRVDGRLFPANEVRIFQQNDDGAFSSAEAGETEEQIISATGRVRRVITRNRLISIAGSDYMVATVTDISALREAEGSNRYLAFHDALTGLPNRALLAERIDHALARRKHGCALIFVNLDRFGHTESHGHLSADELIQEFALRLSGMVRGTDTVARLGGDTFAILLADTSEDPNADEVCRRILIATARSFRLGGAQVQVDASIGVVLTGKEAIDEPELQRRADVALSHAKREGRGGFRIFTQALDDSASQRQALQTDLRDALSSDSGIEVHFQPLVNLTTGKADGFEALARWQHPVRGMVMPAEFIAVAEASGLILELGERILRQACREASTWQPPLRLSVNISPIQFASGDLADTVAQVLADSGFDPARLELEITEGVLTQDPAAALIMLERIRATGVKIVLDDFGTGYSSLSYFRQFPFDKIKIDRSFVAEMLESKRALSIVQAVISLAHGLDLEVVAEGVETEAQLALLAAKGCTHAQGYLLGRPMPIEHFIGSVLPER
jgi:diguanylate cyclase (GGDEF)-like protein/PAS domain S-box-containing protein